MLQCPETGTLWKSSQLLIAGPNENRGKIFQKYILLKYTAQSRNNRLLGLVTLPAKLVYLIHDVLLKIQIVFEGVAGTGYMGDIAVDDILVFHDNNCELQPSSATLTTPLPTPIPTPPSKSPCTLFAKYNVIDFPSIHAPLCINFSPFLKTFWLLEVKISQHTLGTKI